MFWSFSWLQCNYFFVINIFFLLDAPRVNTCNQYVGTGAEFGITWLRTSSVSCRSWPSSSGRDTSLLLHAMSTLSGRLHRWAGSVDTWLRLQRQKHTPQSFTVTFSRVKQVKRVMTCLLYYCVCVTWCSGRWGPADWSDSQVANAGSSGTGSDSPTTRTYTPPQAARAVCYGTDLHTGT